ncbi:MAG: lysylphosphatidylglycerol synthase transmembrane domain-containing protein [Ilumatobacteraceae bacterium]
MTDDATGLGGLAPGTLETGELPPVHRDPSNPVRRQRIRPFRLTIKVLLVVAVFYFLVIPLIPQLRAAMTDLNQVRPIYLVLGVGLQLVCWFCYSLLTRSALGEAGKAISPMRMFRIQLSTKALANIVPGGSAASSALGYRLLTLSGVSGPDAGFALATAGLGSAVVLNLIFWSALLVSIPVRGVNPLYVTAALAGLAVITIVALLVVGLQHGQGRAETFVRWLARKLHFDGEKAAAALRQIGTRLEDLVADRQLLKRVVLWASLNWLLDAASLWVFVWAFGGTLDIDALLVAFGLANVASVIPITPGGLGIVEGIYIPTLVGFGLSTDTATLGVASYRLAQFWFPILLGGVVYASLRVGPWSISRRERLDRLRDIAQRETDDSERRIDFALRHWDRHQPVDVAAGADERADG